MNKIICPEVLPDALPCAASPSANDARSSKLVLDIIMAHLTLDDYRSIFFLLMDKIGPCNFLYLLQKDLSYLKKKFRDKCYDFVNKDALLIELLGTMKKNNLLNILQTCQHVFENDKDTFSQIHSLWKCLYNICEQLSDNEVLYLKEKLSLNPSCGISCAEELFCLAYLENIFQEDNLERLIKIFEEMEEEDCLRILASYQDSLKLYYYPIRRPTQNSPCGMAVILNHVNFQTETGNPTLQNRPESQLDADALKKLWDSYGFKTSIHTDLSAEQVLELFNSIAISDHSSHDIFVACYLSHGHEGVVYGSNSKPIFLSELQHKIANKCPTLVGKPKLFFIQACQGSVIQQGIGSYCPPISSRIELYLQFSRMAMDTPLYSDIAIFCSTIPGYVSFCPSGKNSWFIGALVKNLQKYGEELTILNIMTKVNHEVAQQKGSVINLHINNCKQTSFQWNTLHHELKLKKLLI